jgi:glycerol-3-phosphate acyltransferase PlsY
MPDATVNDPALTLLLAVLGGYLLGAVPFGLILSRLAGYGDIRSIGSGNIGATNVLRTGDKRLALATLLLDGGKGAVAALLAARYGEIASLVAAGAAVLGHNFPIWLRFRGGKGVATTLGVLLAIAWPVGIGAIVAWLAAARLTRISSAGALAAFAAAPLLMLLFGDLPRLLLATVLAVLGILRHHANIRRLLNGSEPKIGARDTGVRRTGG